MKIHIFPGKYHQNGGFSWAMLVSGRVFFRKFYPSFEIRKFVPPFLERRPYPTYGWMFGTSSGPSYLKNPEDVGSQEGIFPATRKKALGQFLTPPYHLDLQATSRDLAPTSAGPAASIAGSIWLVYYLRTHLPSKCTIHVGKCTIVPWIL